MSRGRLWVYGTRAALAWNLFCALTGRPTWCHQHRELLGTDTRRGRLVFMTGFVVFAYWFPGHFLKTPPAPTTPGPDHA